MDKIKEFVKRFKKVIVVSIVGVAVLGVAYFDTYPTYFAQKGTLSPNECEQVAVLVSAYAYKKQNPGVAVPEKVEKILSQATRRAERIAKKIIEMSPSVETYNPSMAYIILAQSCQATEGKFDFTEE